MTLLYCRTCGLTTGAGFEFGVQCCSKQRVLASLEDWLVGLTDEQRRVIWWVMNGRPASPLELADDEMATTYPDRGFGFINDAVSLQESRSGAQKPSPTNMPGIKCEHGCGYVRLWTAGPPRPCPRCQPMEVEPASPIDGLKAEIAELRATLAAERGQPEGAVDGWAPGPLGGWDWVRILTDDDDDSGRAWLWVDTNLGAHVDGIWMPCMYGFTDTREHPDEHSPHEISEWSGHDVGPREAMRAADARYATDATA